MTTTPARQFSATLLIAALLPACGGRPSPAPSSPALPQISGSYSGPTTDNSTTPAGHPLTFSIKFLRPGGVTTFRACEGTVVIQQNGATFSGSFTQSATCAPVAGQIVNGSVSNDGKVTFALVAAGSDPMAWTGFANCTAVTNGTTGFTGSITATAEGPLLDASFANEALMQCAADGTLTVNVHIRGVR